VAGNVTAYTISADNEPAVNWDQAPYVGYTTQVVADVVLSTCSNARRASGFFVIMASAYVELHPNVLDQALFKLSLLDVTDPANPVTLTYTYCTAAQATVALTYVVPISGPGANQTFALVGHAPDGSTDVSNCNLTVMYFPRQNN
jgi:hypothetical protein